MSSTSTISKSARRRKRHRKTVKYKNYTERFEQFKPKYLHSLLWTGYNRALQQEKIYISKDLQNLCSLFLPLLTPLEDENMNKLTRSICELQTQPAQPPTYYKKMHFQWIQKLNLKQLKIYPSRLKFNEGFNKLWSYQRRIICYKIMRINKWPINALKVEKADASSIYELMLFIEYTLFNCKGINKLNLSNMDLNNTHILWLCHTIEKITKHWTQNKNKRKRNARQKNMALTEINLSSNKNITDKHVDLLLRTIKKHAPSMQHLRLSDSNVTNKSISIIIKHGIVSMKVYLDGCTAVTAKELIKYPKSHGKYLFCTSLIHYKKVTDETKAKKQVKKAQTQQSYNQHERPYSECEQYVRWDHSDWI